MLLTADVGNTNVKLGIYDGDELKYKLKFSTDVSKTSDEFAVELYTFFQIYNIDVKSIDSSIISSVVPNITYPLRTAISTVTGVRSIVLGPGVKTGLDIKIEHPETLGADIVAGCVGACEKYGGPFIIVFMGTATAIVYVDENNTYYGGAIAPEDSWLGTDWNYTPFDEATERKLLVFGVTNDQIGYLLTENDWRSYLTENEEIVSTGPKAGAHIANAYLTLVDEIK